MKVNILLNSNQIEQDHLNIDPYATKKSVGKVYGNIVNLDEVVHHNSCEEFLARDVIDYIDRNVTPMVLENWLSKIRHGGRIVIGGTDLVEATQAIGLGRVDTNEGMMLLYGTQDKPKKQCLSIFDLMAFLEQKDLK